MMVKVIIIGAGVGGTATAARLSKKGFQVEVYEKNTYNGGRCSLIHHNGHRFDQGPSLYLMPKIFEQLFKDLGEDIENHIDLLKCPSNYIVHFHDGQTFELTTDLSKLSRSLEKYEGDNESTFINFLNYLKESHMHYRMSVKIAMQTDFQHWYDFFRPKFLPYLIKLHIFDSVYNRVCKYFKSDYMRQAFTFQAMYLGMSPYDAPAPYSLLQYTELAEGIWYPKGGFHKVLESVEGIAARHGARFHYGAGVREITVDGRTGAATGVRLADGTAVAADVVVCNADLVYAYNRLLPATRYGARLARGAHTSSSVSFYWCMSAVVPQLRAHNVFLAGAYRESFERIFAGRALPDEPSFYVNVPSRVDPTAAPPGRDTVVVLVPTGHRAADADLDALVDRARDRVIDTVQRRLGIADLRAMIVHETVNDPRSWQAEFNLWDGSILGLSHSLLQVLWFRPSLKCKIFDNLYFVGASAQPGTGVPVVLCGAKMLEKQLCDKYLGRETQTAPWQKRVFLIVGVLSVLTILVFWFFSLFHVV